MADWRGSRYPGESGPPGLVHITVTLTSDEVEDLERQAAADGISVTDVVRRSLALGRIASQAQRKGAKLMISDRGGELRPIELPSVPL
jgi:hypothetical protein